MVRVNFFLITFLSFFLLGFNTPDLFLTSSSDEVVLKLEVGDELAVENKPFWGKLIIYHPHGQEVDNSSFEIEGKKLEAQPLGQGKQSSITIVNGKKKEVHLTTSYYQFEVKGQERGTHLLPPIQVKVGGHLYQTEPKNYIVNAPEISNNFNLSSYLDMPKPIYPGQTFTATYRIAMSEHIEIYYDHLPLLDLKEFQKVGKRQSRVFYHGNKRVEEFSQMYEVEKEGEFQIEPSFLEGRVYNEDFFGRRRYKKEMLRAETKAENIQINAFPKEGKPSSFNGAIGDFTMDVFLDSGNQVCVGDKLKLKICFKGKEGLNSIRFPNLSHREDFKDNFRFSDLPLLAKKQDNEKIFVFEVRPMREKITEIPSFEFAYFNPTKNSYETLKSAAIPITLLPVKALKETSTPVLVTEHKEVGQKNEQDITSSVEQVQPSPIEIKGVFRIEQPLAKTNQNFHVLNWALIFMSLLLLQVGFKFYFFSRKRKKNSAFFFQQALKNNQPLRNYHLLLEKSLLLRLKEQKFVKDLPVVDYLGPHGIVGEVREFLQELSMQLFSGQNSFCLEESQKKAKALYKRIGENF